MSDSELHPLRQKLQNSLFSCAPPATSGFLLRAVVALSIPILYESQPLGEGERAPFPRQGTAFGEQVPSAFTRTSGSWQGERLPQRSGADAASRRLYRAPLPFAISPPSSCSARTPPCLPCSASAPPAIWLIEGGEAAAGVSFDAHQGLSEPPSVRKLGAPDKSWAGSSYPASMEPPQAGDWRSS